ncbi:MAG: hypothetical protein ABDH25_02170 [Dictyoglomaceae bacterium]
MFIFKKKKEEVKKENEKPKKKKTYEIFKRWEVEQDLWIEYQYEKDKENK